MNVDEMRAILLDHSRAPRNVGALTEPHALTGSCKNPLCGDHIRVAVLVCENRVADVKLLPEGCTMAVASASLMGEWIRNKSTDEIEQVRVALSDALTDARFKSEPWPQGLDAFAALAHLRVSPGRVPCALIGWIALKEALVSVTESVV